MVKRVAKVKLFYHITNEKVDLLIHIFHWENYEYSNGMTLKNENDHDDHYPFGSSARMTLLLTILNS